jgi:ABC-type uncharacterized transport system involved in gliding motility auxiliary subunit
MFLRCALPVTFIAAVNLVVLSCVPAQVDLTGGGTYTLAPQTRKLLAALQARLEITVLAPRVARTAGERHFAQSALYLRQVVELCQGAQPLVHFQELDPQESAAARQLEQQYPDAGAPCVLVTYGAPGEASHEVLNARDLAEFHAGRDRRLAAVDGLAEQALAGALARLTAGKKQATVYVTTGHGELALDDRESESRQGLGILAGVLERLDCDLRPLDLMAAGRVPDDSSVVLVAGGGQPWNADESEKLDNYLRQGGKAVVLVDLTYDLRQARVVSNGLEELLSEFGVAVGDDRVITQGFTGEIEIASPGLPAAEEHPLARSLPQAPVTLFECRSLRASTSLHQTSTTVVPLLVSHSAPRAWADGDFGQGPPVRGGKNDSDGPVAMAVAVERRQAGEAAPVLVVVGDAEFISNRAVSAAGGQTNLRFMISSLNWLRGRRELLGDIPLRRYEACRLAGTADEQRRIVWGSSLVLCSLISTIGATVWMSRRRG